MKSEKIRQRKVLTIVTAMVMLIASASPCFAAESGMKNSILDGSKNTTPSQVTYVRGYIKPDVTVKYNAETLEFYDYLGKTVYPVIYNGSTYLPVRAVSSLMDKDIEWRENLSSIFIGKTFFNPMGKYRMNPEKYHKVVSDSAIEIGLLKPEQVGLAVRPNFKVLFNFEEQTFRDANGEVVYPLVYAGSTYLPLRAISELMGETIEWDGNLKIIYIGSKVPLSPQDQEKYEVSKATRDIQEKYKSVADIYAEGTSAISTLREQKSPEEIINLGTTITELYNEAKNLTSNIRKMKSAYDELTEEETEAIDELINFAGLNENYILCMENIVYMLIEGQDFTMMQDAFAVYAVSTMEASESARLAVEAL